VLWASLPADPEAACATLFRLVSRFRRPYICSCCVLCPSRTRGARANDSMGGGQIALSHITRRGDAPRAARRPVWRRDEANRVQAKGVANIMFIYQPKSPHQSTAPPRPPRSAFRLRPPTLQVPAQCSPRDRRPSPPNTPHAPSRAAPEFSELKWLGQIYPIKRLLIRRVFMSSGGPTVALCLGLRRCDEPAAARAQRRHQDQ